MWNTNLHGLLAKKFSSNMYDVPIQIELCLWKGNLIINHILNNRQQTF